MNSRVFFLLAVGFVFIGILLFSRKIATVRDSQDELNEALSDIRKVLTTNGSAAAYQDLGAGNETRYRVKYALAPAYLCTANYLTDRRYDTFLCAFPPAATDSLRLAVETGRQVLMERRAGGNTFVLLKSNPR
jgi:hypothetical protein